MLQRANSPYVHAFFNYLSIVEICIDKGLSGGDLCSCQLSQRTVPLRHQLDRSACKTRLRGLSGGLRRQSRSMWAKKGLAGWDFFIWKSMGLVGLWPGGEQGGAGGGSVAGLKPLWVSASCCETWHWLWHTQGLEWHWPGYKQAEYTQNLKRTHAGSKPSLNQRIIEDHEIEKN